MILSDKNGYILSTWEQVNKLLARPAEASVNEVSQKGLTHSIVHFRGIFRAKHDKKQQKKVLKEQ